METDERERESTSTPQPQPQPQPQPRPRSKFTYKDLDRLGSSRGGTETPLRVVAHIDLDAFYAQCETVRLHLPPTLPLAVQQWGNLIAINYPARTHGLTSRHVSALEALKICPELRLVHIPTWQPGDEKWSYREGEGGITPPDYPDIARNKACLDYYRGESRRIMRVVREGCGSWRPWACGGEEEEEEGGGDGVGEVGGREQARKTSKARLKSRVVVEKASIDEVFLELGGRLEEVVRERYGALLEREREAGGGVYLPLPPQDEVVEWFGTNILPAGAPEGEEEKGGEEKMKVEGDDGKKEGDDDDGDGDIPPSTQVQQEEKGESTEEPQPQPQQPQPQTIHPPNEPIDWDTILLSLSCSLLSHLRTQIHTKLGYTSSAGISTNKLLSKLASSIHKPNKQTLIAPSSIDYFLSTIKLTKLRNLGGKLGHQIVETFGTESIPEIRRIGAERIARECGISMDTARWIGEMVEGIDRSAVVGRGSSSGSSHGDGEGGIGSGAGGGGGGGGGSGGGSDTRIKSMLSAKSFRPAITTHDQALSWLKVFVCDVFGRMKEEEEEDALDYEDGLPRKIRRPKTIALSYHRVGGGGSAGAGVGGRSKSRPITGEVTKAKLMELASGLLGQAEEALGKGIGGFYPCAGLSLHLGGFEEVDNPMGKGGLGRFFTTATNTNTSKNTGSSASSSSNNNKNTLEDKSEDHDGGGGGGGKRQKLDHDSVDPHNSNNHDTKEPQLPPPAPPPPPPQPPSQKRFFFTHNNNNHPSSDPPTTTIPIEHHTCKTCNTTFPTTSPADIIAHDDWHYVQNLVEEERREMRVRLESQSQSQVNKKSGSGSGRGGAKGSGRGGGRERKPDPSGLGTWRKARGGLFLGGVGVVLDVEVEVEVGVGAEPINGVL
ncbi:hypothetical protein DFH27DRAFT_526391 [Peziza echinospora]|nr:hypothetical protein DFH27DRAFT_526391 [Peziza echinospora]